MVLNLARGNSYIKLNLSIPESLTKVYYCDCVDGEFCDLDNIALSRCRYYKKAISQKSLVPKTRVK